jgi:hypothetical protein
MEKCVLIKERKAKGMRETDTKEKKMERNCLSSFE